MSYNNLINHQVSSPDPDRVASESKIKGSNDVEAARKSQENCMKKLKNRLLKDNQMA